MADTNTNLPSLAELAEWLERLAAAHHARMQINEPQTTAQQAVTDNLRLLQELLLGNAPDGQVSRAVWLLIAEGVLTWRPPQDSNTTNTSPLVVKSLVSAALWPLVIVRKLPAGWEDALQDISSPEITQLVLRLRNAYTAATSSRVVNLITRNPSRETPETIALHLTQELNKSEYTVGMFRLLEDLSDPDRGGDVLNALILARDGVVPDPAADRVERLRSFLRMLPNTAISGLIGNRFDAIVVWLAEHIFNMHPITTPSPTTTTNNSDTLRDSILYGTVLYGGNTGCLHYNLHNRSYIRLAFLPSLRELRGFALSFDGNSIVFGRANWNMSPPIADLFLSHLDGSKRRFLFRVQAGRTGAAGWDGFGILGLSLDSRWVIFQDATQVYIAHLDGSHRRPVTTPIQYGASSSPLIYWSPKLTSILVIQPWSPNHLTIYSISDGTRQNYELERPFTAIGFGRDDTHILAVRCEPAFGPGQGNPFAHRRSIVGIEEIDVQSGRRRLLMNINNVNTRPWDVITSNVSDRYVIINTTMKIHLLDLVSGLSNILSLPGYLLGSPILLRINS